MKKYIWTSSVIAFLIPLFLFVSCSRDFKGLTVTLHINKSGNVIDVFIHKAGNIFKHQNIKNDSLFSIAQDLFSKDAIKNRRPALLYQPTDSVVVIFDKQKRLVFLSENISKTGPGYVPYSSSLNILNGSNYKKGAPDYISEKEKSHVDFWFEFTKEHYNTAIDCKGKCE